MVALKIVVMHANFKHNMAAVLIIALGLAKDAHLAQVVLVIAAIQFVLYLVLVDAEAHAVVNVIQNVQTDALVVMQIVPVHVQDAQVVVEVNAKADALDAKRIVVITALIHVGTLAKENVVIIVKMIVQQFVEVIVKAVALALVMILAKLNLVHLVQ